MVNREEIIGIYSKGKGDYGFVDVDDGGKKKGYYVFSRNSKNAISGDKVLADVKVFKGKQEAVIKKILDRRKDPLVGEFSFSKNSKFGFVKVADSILSNDIFLAAKYTKRLKNGDLVAVKITSWDKKNPEGELVKRLGKPGEKGVDILSIAYEYGARIGFGHAIKKEIDILQREDINKQIKKRKDLRDLFTITIDGSDSKDLDDAISLEKNPPSPLNKGEYKLYVHIADVAHYVRENHAIDKEAKRRGTSIYLVDKVIPMLPEELSNGLCSLNPGETKLTLTAEIDINSAGHIKNTKVYESAIKSDFRMTSEGVQDIVDNKKDLENHTYSASECETLGDMNTLVKTIFLSEELRKVLRKYKKSLGVLDFDFAESKIIVDEDGNPIEFKKYERYNSHKIIEEFMIVANEAVSKKYSNIPFLYRVHPKPSEEDLYSLQEKLKIFGFNISNLGDLNSANISNILNEIKGHDCETLISKMILRAMEKAIYSDKSDGHFGLALNYYSHFTSPIRRYPDLQIHRIIKEQTHKKLSSKRINELKNKLPKIAKSCSESEIKAEKLEYKIRDMMACKYMTPRIGERFTGTISGMIDAGVFVELENTIEGFVELNPRGGANNYIMDLDLYKATNIYSNNVLKVGDKLEVELSSVDDELYRIDFALIK